MLPLIKKILRDIHVLWNIYGSSAFDNKAMPFIYELQELGLRYYPLTWNISIVEFPTVIDNVVVMLSWRSDEASVKYYREMNEPPGYNRCIIPKDYMELFSRNTDKIKSE